MKLLSIEDDPEIARFIQQGFQEAGQTCDTVNTAAEGLNRAMSGVYDLIIVDRLLPDMEGLRLISMIRAGHITVPIIVLSALSAVNDRVDGLKAGADDYLVKPFAFSELHARAFALTRRQALSAEQSVDTELTVADLTLNLTTQKVTRAGETIELLAKEYDLLKLLMQHTGQVVTRTMLLENVWDLHFDPQTNIIDVHISRLRQKIDKPFGTDLLHTIRGKGYSLKEIPHD